MSVFPLDSVVPPDGFHFFDDSTGQRERIDGDSVLDLAQKILKFRLQNGKDPGNPMQEIVAYICGTWPHFCRDTEIPLVPGIPQGGPLSSKVLAWMNRFYPGSANDPGVSQGEADRRASICAACPKNQDFKRSGCGSCIAAVERISFIWRRRRETPVDGQLSGCEATGQHNPTAVHAGRLPDLSESERADLPEGCWRK